jgi:hypothetical protein
MRRVVVAALLLGGCASSEDRPAQTQGETGGGDAAVIAPINDVGAADDAETAVDAWPEAAAYDPSCEAEICTADERCVEIAAGSRCMHACVGQLACASGQSSWCTRQGGARCVAD